MNETNNKKIPLCPSARPEQNNSVVFGIINGTIDKPNVTDNYSTTELVREVAKPPRL